MLIFLPGMYQEILVAPLEVNLSVIYLGLFPNSTPVYCIGLYYISYWCFRATSSLYLTPVIACFIAWVWLGEVPTFISVVGGVITILGVLIAHVSLKKNIRSEKYSDITG